MRLRFLWLSVVVFVLSDLSVRSQTFSSNLPIVVITTNGQNIDGAWFDVEVNLGIIDHGPGVRNYRTDAFNNFNGKALCRLQGSSSILWPKRSFRINLMNMSGVKINASIMGLPSEEDWVFKALYQDKSLLRDDLAFRIYNQMGHYSSRSVFFELFVDNDYRGVYQLEEKVKRDKNRVNISKLEPHDVAGDQLTGGYIISLDNFDQGDPGWYSQYNSNYTNDSANYFLYYYPKPDSIVQVQKDYIKNYFDAYENALKAPNFADPVNGYRKYIDVNSFIDNFLLNELSKNVDGYRRSTFFYKDKASTVNSKLVAGPVWDYNIAFGNADYNGGNSTSGWEYPQWTNVNFVPFWWAKFLTDSSFTSQLKCRYKQLRSSVLDPVAVTKYIDDMAAYLNESMSRNFVRWPIMGQVIYPNPQPVPTNYAGEIAALKNFIQARIAWLDNNLPGLCTTGIDEIGNPVSYFNTYPNPFQNSFTVIYNINEPAKVKMELMNMLGECSLLVVDGYRSTGMFKEEIRSAGLADGTYILKLSVNENVYYQKLMKLENE